MSQKPSVGRVVHYTLRDGRSAGQNRPAIVVRAWDDEQTSYPPGTVNLQVFLDGSNDDGAEGIDGNASPVALTTWVASVHEDDPTAMAERVAQGRGPGYQPGTWHWPPRVS